MNTNQWINCNVWSSSFQIDHVIIAFCFYLTRQTGRLIICSATLRLSWSSGSASIHINRCNTWNKLLKPTYIAEPFDARGSASHQQLILLIWDIRYRSAFIWISNGIFSAIRVSMATANLMPIHLLSISRSAFQWLVWALQLKSYFLFMTRKPFGFHSLVHVFHEFDPKIGCIWANSPENTEFRAMKRQK